MFWLKWVFLSTLINPSQMKPTPSPISVKFKKAPIKKASTKKTPKIKMTTPSRTLRNAAVASLTVFITERGWGSGGLLITMI